ncbi:MAG TPA: hypothetical protein VN661_00980 [Candidatus Acidoferrales bacterium]|nr:hypothetical protein [Candidatus Acidoferrales bacterium]
MRWYELKIRRYEHGRWAQEPDRRVLPFAWGLDHIGGSAGDPEPRAFLDRFAEQTIAASDAWYAATPAADYALDDSENVLTFTSQVASPWPENNRVYGQFFRASSGGPAAIVLAQWNARWEEQQGLCRWLNRLGITALKLSLPYHDRRAVPGHPRADHLIGPNIGLTLQANHQAVLDVRRAILWLDQQGYDRLGIVGTSVGSAIAFVTLCHEPRLRAGAFLHVSTHYGDVVPNGLTTMNVWESLRAKVSPAELQRYWSPISPFPYIAKLRGARKKILAIHARYDPTFWPELTRELLQKMRAEEVTFDECALPCGHYSLGVAPFSYIAGYRVGASLFRALA